MFKINQRVMVCGDPDHWGWVLQIDVDRRRCLVETEFLSPRWFPESWLHAI